MENAILEKNLKTFQRNLTILTLVIGVTSAVSVCYGFYYKTTDIIDIHTEKIKFIEINVEKIKDDVNTTAIYQGASKVEVRALQDQIGDVKKSQERIENKLDKLILKEK